MYYDTAYADWPRAVAALERLGVRHVRDGIFDHPDPAWADWDARYRRSVELAAARGIRFDLIAGRPQNPTGSIDALVALAAGPLRRAVASIEGPNEYDLSGSRSWSLALTDYQRALYRAVRGEPRLDGVPVVAPSFGRASQGRIGRLDDALDLGNLHPYTGGQPPTQDTLRGPIADARILSRRKPLFATEAGFHDAMAATEGQPPVPGDVAAAYVLRTYLEHFAAGIRRTFVYELLDEKPDPGGVDPEQHFGLLRTDFSEKPAATALRRMLDLLGPRTAPPDLEPLRFRLTGDEVRHVLLQRADGDHVLMVWHPDATGWDPGDRRRVVPDVARVALVIDDAAAVSVVRPVRSPVPRTVPPTAGRRRLAVGLDPLVVRIRTP